MSDSHAYPMPDDTVVVQEVREARERVWRESGSTFKALFDAMRKHEAERRATDEAAAVSRERRKSA